MYSKMKTALAVAGLVLATQVSAQVTFYEHDGFEGSSFSTRQQVRNFARSGFNDRASSVIVQSNQWEVCEDARFSGRCVVLRPGRYASLSAMGLNDRISSVRMVSRNTRIDDDRYAPAPVADYQYGRRDNERTYLANVTSVRAVVGPPEQRCWMERGQVTQDRGSANVPGAIVGAILGGVLGHQVGGGRGKDIATAGGAVAGAAVGANVGRNSGEERYGQDVQRCATTQSQARPEYWEVTYDFRGTQHRVQMTSPPGATINVNSEGEPRG